MSAGDDLDTDILIAMLCSLLPEPYPATSVLLDALVESKGDVQVAATILSRQTKPVSRKRVNRLDDWLQSDSGPSKVARIDDNINVLQKIEEKAPTSAGTVSANSMNALTPRSPASSSRPKKSAFDLLKDKPPSKSIAPARPAPLLLATPALVEQHVPCTMHLDILPPDLACRLFYAMVEEAAGWERNSWWLFDRLVESPHKTSFWVRMQDRNPGDISYEQASNMWYNGRKVEPPKNFLPVMEEACEIIERVVSEQLELRERYALEWGGPCHGPPGRKWRANVAASNCYTGRNESVGFHSDILSYLGPYTTIASLSLGTTRLFRLREVIPKEEADQRAAQTFNIPLSHNSLTIMHATCQEYFKHAIPPQPALDVFRPPFPPRPSAPSEPSNIRINLTFRFYRPDFHPSTIPRCKCGVPMILRPDMKGRPRKGEERRREIKYWWTCYSGAQTEKAGCGVWQVFDAKAEGRGPFVGDLVSTAAASTADAATTAEQ